MDKKRKIERNGLPGHGGPDDESFDHFLQYFSYQNYGPNVTKPMIEHMNNNRNCYDTEGKPSKLDLTHEQEHFIRVTGHYPPFASTAAGWKSRSRAVAAASAYRPGTGRY